MFPTMPLFDAHLHIIDARFPLYENNGYLPPIFTCSDYCEAMSSYLLAGGAIVSGSFQKFDVSYLVDALEKLGNTYIGVVQLPYGCSDADLIRLNHKGVRAVRFNLKRGGSEDVKHIYEFSKRIFDLVGWHVELYVDSKNLDVLYNTLIQIPKVSIDHLGLSQGGQKTLLKLVAKGVKVKATGFSRTDFNALGFMAEIHSENPEALMFGTDLPSTRAPRPYSDDDFFAIVNHFNEDDCLKIFKTNAIHFYRPAGYFNN